MPKLLDILTYELHHTGPLLPEAGPSAQVDQVPYYDSNGSTNPPPPTSIFHPPSSFLPPAPPTPPASVSPSHVRRMSAACRAHVSLSNLQIGRAEPAIQDEPAHVVPREDELAHVVPREESELAREDDHSGEGGDLHHGGDYGCEAGEEEAELHKRDLAAMHTAAIVVD